ncbi:GntR family transcriptional regulator [Acinetobacter chinensis]|uniref:GntR family transcriptional regulator n=1 Tax=Acinetobacter chinensis TaxID=2004650 RepID=A0A3B7M5C1_9GAMM|nr:MULTISPECIES: GntR family transcriptional regulator [Acinetobacter]AXY57659.1 GntR family transcriptional regulator [Acinetobacter chinensis]AXY60952.1 GntR family transcriptional regulator [Acinetobacter sp. WCHAc010052]MDV2467433.1 GntR family transcriptional regulator [Acinetobacter chinensis]
MTSIAELPLSIQISKKLEDDIIYGFFLPGTKLDEQELCERYGASRTPIREALKLLAAEGLVEIRPRRGAIIPTINSFTLCEMFEVMAELEAMCGRLAARRIQPEEKQELQRLHHLCQDYLNQNDSENYYEANRLFHFAIYQASHNSFLIEQACALHKRLHPYRRLQLRVNHRMNHSFSEHSEILDAIFSGNEQEAEALLKAHVVIQGEKFTDFMATLDHLKI